VTPHQFVPWRAVIRHMLVREGLTSREMLDAISPGFRPAAKRTLQDMLYNSQELRLDWNCRLVLAPNDGSGT
jgi:hypothetical protein